MTSAAFGLSSQTASASWHPGTYLTDGRRLLWVLGVSGKTVELEDSATECIERWPVRRAADSLREVKPCSPG
jgi:hypothetical protein